MKEFYKLMEEINKSDLPNYKKSELIKDLIDKKNRCNNIWFYIRLFLNTPGGLAPWGYFILGELVWEELL